MKNTKPTGPIKVGLVGLGRAGWGMHLPEMGPRADKFQVVACYDPIAARMEKAQERLGCRVCRSYEELLGDPEVEMVDIASPSLFHVPQAVLALKAKKFVFLEKPAAMNDGEGKKLKAAAKKSKGLFIRHNRRFEPAFTHIGEIMASGLLGRVFEIKLRRHSYARRDDWQTLISSGGGQLNNWGPHLIDHAVQFLGGRATEVWGDLKKVAAVGDAEDHLKIVFRDKHGLVVDVEISGGAALPEPEYLIFGTKGALTCDGKEITLKYLDPSAGLAPRKARKDTPPVEGPFGSPDVLPWKEEKIKVSPKASCDTDTIWDHLHGAIRLDKTFPISLDESLEVVRVTSLVKKGSPFLPKKSSGGQK